MGNWCGVREWTHTHTRKNVGKCKIERCSRMRKSSTDHRINAFHTRFCLWKKLSSLSHIFSRILNLCQSNDSSTKSDNTSYGGGVGACECFRIWLKKTECTQLWLYVRSGCEELQWWWSRWHYAQRHRVLLEVKDSCMARSPMSHQNCVVASHTHTHTHGYTIGIEPNTLYK